MSRQVRSFGQTGWAHIMIRGINHENLFYDEEDYQRFLMTVERYREECRFELAALCLMSNHVHFLIYEKNGCFSEIMKRITVSYVHYYNAKYKRVGHVLQDRFKSEMIDNAQYLLTAARYIYQNPQKAGICSADQYPYTIINKTGILSDFFETEAELDAYLNKPNNDQCLECSYHTAPSDDDVIEMIRKLTGDCNPQFLQTLEREQRNLFLHALKEKGISVRHLSRLTGINRNIIQRA